MSWRTRGRRRLRRRRRRREGTTTLLPTVVEKRGLPPSHVTKGRERAHRRDYTPLFIRLGIVGNPQEESEFEGKGTTDLVLCSEEDVKELELRGNPFRLLRLDYCTQRRRKGLFFGEKGTVQKRRGRGERKDSLALSRSFPFPCSYRPRNGGCGVAKNLGKILMLDHCDILTFDLRLDEPRRANWEKKKRSGAEIYPPFLFCLSMVWDRT